MPKFRGFRTGAVALIAIFWVVAGIARAEPATQPSAVVDPNSFEFYSVGDWGIDSPDRQAVADAMAKTATSEPAHRPQCVLLLGDNYYVKLKSVDDPQIQKFFEQTYDPQILNVPFYALLGNHDYSGKNAQIEFAYAARGNTRFKMPAEWYRLDLPENHPMVTLLMLDSNHDTMTADKWNEQLQWLEAELGKPHAQWLICCAHHNMFGNGSHGDNGVLQTTWGVLFKKYKVDFYLCGHEHTLQHLEIPDWYPSFVIAGGGGAPRKGMLKDIRGPFSRSILGFADFSLDSQSATVRLIGGDAQPVHTFVRDADGTIHILFTTKSDAATTHPLRVINGIDDSPSGKNAD